MNPQNKERPPHRVVYICFAPEDIALAEELKSRLQSKDYPAPEFSFPKPVFSHLSSENPTLIRFRIEDAACIVLIYTEHTNNCDRVIEDLKLASTLLKPVFPVFLSDKTISPELKKYVDTTDYQIKATCFTKPELFAQLGANELMRCIFHI